MTALGELILSVFRRNEIDVVNLYNSFSRLMQIISGGSMLNFGFWDADTKNPLDAQYNLSSIIAEFASLHGACTVIDAGSGFSAPALHWNSKYKNATIICININFRQLKESFAVNASNASSSPPPVPDINTSLSESQFSKPFADSRVNKNLVRLNSTSTMLPVKSNSVDRVIAFESAHHFRPIEQFIKESKRTLKRSGFLVLAIPVITNSSSPPRLLSLPLSVKLGLLSVTWASEHYNSEQVKSIVKTQGFQIEEIKYIGSNVYIPLARYYVENRKELRGKIIKEYPKVLESIIYKSLLKMEKVSQKGVIEYMLLKARKT
ncbi:MAG: class I SAM-dependent methyltransferase [Thermoproteota archaeon]|nr:class I SAM-dependent methyltransferase [Thermoproteota archaeon]